MRRRTDWSAVRLEIFGALFEQPMAAGGAARPWRALHELVRCIRSSDP